MAKKSTKRTGRKRPAAILEYLRSRGLPDDFALSPHFPSGKWYKVVRKKRHYCGDLDDPQKALEYYLDRKDAWQAGRNYTADTRLAVGTLVNAFLTAADGRRKAGEIKTSTFDWYKRVGEDIVAEFGRNRSAEGLDPADFRNLRGRFADRYGPSELAKRIQLTRSIFKYGYDAELMDKPKRFGPDFKKPSRKVLRVHRRTKPRRMFEADDLRKLIDAAEIPLKAMILLGINCGWGNSDISELPLAALDLDNAHADYPRPKTGIERQAVLWPETVAALREVLEKRREPKDDADRNIVFVTKYGKRWIRYNAGKNGKPGSWTDGVNLQFVKLLKAQGLHEPGVAFYALRHTFQTIAEGSGDLPAVMRIMGHHDDSMSERYRERIDVDRLRKVSDHVHAWLWSKSGSKES